MPTDQNVNPGQTVTVTVEISGITDLFGFQIDILYDNSLLALNSVSEGTFLSEGGGISTLWIPPATTTPGLIDNAAVSRTGGTGVDGSGVLLTLQFNATNTGTADITLSRVKLSDSGSNPLLDGADADTEVDAGYITNGTVTIVAPPPDCPDGDLDPGEECDSLIMGDPFNGETCITQGFDGGSLICSSSCTIITTACYECGDGSINTGEQCDGSNLNGQTCVTRGYDQGTLSCYPQGQAQECKFDESQCVTLPSCGDGTRNGTEVCEGNDLGDATCQSLGWDAGTLACTGSCTYDESGCFDYCGNGTVDDPPGTQYDEVCDGSNLNSKTCVGLGFPGGGTLLCSPNCKSFDTTNCIDHYCGNNVKENTEACDGTDLDSQTCQDLGFGGGDLGCYPKDHTSECLFDTTGCTDVCIDMDGDGYGVIPTNGCGICNSVGVPGCLDASFADCDDGSAGINPGVSESTVNYCSDGIDNDCDGTPDCADTGCNGKACGLLDCSTNEDYCVGNVPYFYSGTETLYCSPSGGGTCDGTTCTPVAGADCGTNASCGNGSCLVCDQGPPPRANCDQNPATGAGGCEINLHTNESNCGSCGNACQANFECVLGVCTDPCDSVSCGDNATCDNTGGTANCECQAGYLDCDGNGTNGCEYAGSSCPACEEGEVQSCTTAGAGCSGTRECISGAWTTCAQDPADQVCTPGNETNCVPTINEAECPALFSSGTQTCDACGEEISACSISGSIECCPGDTTSCTTGGCDGERVCNSSGVFGACVKNDPQCGVSQNGSQNNGQPADEDQDGDGILASEGDCNDLDKFVGKCSGCFECINEKYCGKITCSPTVCPADECRGELKINYPDLIANLCEVTDSGAGLCSSNPCTPTIAYNEECALLVEPPAPPEPPEPPVFPGVPDISLNTGLVVGVVIVVLLALGLLVFSLKMQF